MKTLRKIPAVSAGIVLTVILSLSGNLYVFAAADGTQFSDVQTDNEAADFPTGSDPKELQSDETADRYSNIFEDILRQLIYAYPDKSNPLKSYRLMQELRRVSPEKSKTWELILPYWDAVNSEDFINAVGLESAQAAVQDDTDALAWILPSDLPEDDSLCIVGLGFALNDDGSMREELSARLELILACAMQYPHSYILVTGGGTAKSSSSVTEADSMAQWLKEKGVDESRIIIENKSLTTVENAVFSCALLKNEYPQVRNLVIASSDYHIPLGCLLFQAQLWLTQDSDEADPEVIANAGISNIRSGRIDMNMQAMKLAELLERQ